MVRNMTLEKSLLRKVRGSGSSEKICSASGSRASAWGEASQKGDAILVMSAVTSGEGEEDGEVAVVSAAVGVRFGFFFLMEELAFVIIQRE